MNKSIKIIIGILISIVIIWGVIFAIDYTRCSNLKEPIFVISKQENDLNIKSITYQGLGYKVEVRKNVSSEYGEQITKVEMYMFNKIITGAVTEFNVEDSNINGSNKFRAIVLSCNEKTLIVKPLEEKDIKILSDKVSIGLGNNNDMIYMEGQELLITYTGDIMDTYPTQIKTTKIQTEMDYKTKIEDLPQDYNLVNAIKDNCVISIHGRKIYNKDELDRFLENVNNNNADFMRCINYTIEGDMLITDINFEGSNSFRITMDWTRDEWSSKEDRTYKYGRYTKLEKEENGEGTSIILTNPIEGDIKEVIATGYDKDVEIINNYEINFLLDMHKSEENKTQKITTNGLDKKYDYDIYYYGLESVDIEINDEKIDLKEALLTDKITMEEIIEQAEKDSKVGIIGSDMYKEGGTKEYYYGTYTIIKSHSLDGNRDVYIGIPEMRLNMVR